jgi:hypothetical protein
MDLGDHVVVVFLDALVRVILLLVPGWFARTSGTPWPPALGRFARLRDEHGLIRSRRASVSKTSRRRAITQSPFADRDNALRDRAQVRLDKILKPARTAASGR